MVSKPLLWHFWCAICSLVFSVFSVAPIVDVAIKLTIIHWRPLPLPEATLNFARSCHCRYHRNRLSMIYIIRKESASSEVPYAFMHHHSLCCCSAHSSIPKGHSLSWPLLLCSVSSYFSCIIWCWLGRRSHWSKVNHWLLFSPWFFSDLLVK